MNEPAFVVIGYCVGCGAVVHAYTKDATSYFKTCHHDDMGIAWEQDSMDAEPRE